MHFGVHVDIADPTKAADLPSFLEAYADRQLDIVMTPKLLQLRRLVIGEGTRFPELAEALYEHGPKRAIATLARMFERLAERGLLRVDDPTAAATGFNWLVMGEPVNRAMLLGDAAIPTAAERGAQVRAAVRVFLAAYGAR